MTSNGRKPNREPSDVEIADAAMRVYGHPWYAARVLTTQRTYLRELSLHEPKQIDNALDILRERARGHEVKLVSTYHPNHGEPKQVAYDVQAELERMGAPLAPCGVRVLTPALQAEYDAERFGETLHEALVGIADAVYESHVFTLTSTGGKTLYCTCGEWEKANRVRKNRKGAKIALCDAQGNALVKRNKYGWDDEQTITMGSVRECNRNKLPDKWDYLYANDTEREEVK